MSKPDGYLIFCSVIVVFFCMSALLVLSSDSHTKSPLKFKCSRESLTFSDLGPFSGESLVKITFMFHISLLDLIFF